MIKSYQHYFLKLEEIKMKKFCIYLVLTFFLYAFIISLASLGINLKGLFLKFKKGRIYT